MLIVLCDILICSPPPPLIPKFRDWNEIKVRSSHVILFNECRWENFLSEMDYQIIIDSSSSALSFLNLFQIFNRWMRENRFETAKKGRLVFIRSTNSRVLKVILQISLNGPSLLWMDGTQDNARRNPYLILSSTFESPVIVGRTAKRWWRRRQKDVVIHTIFQEINSKKG